MNRTIYFLAVALIAASCAGQKPQQAMTWQKHVMDGHRTGVTAVTGTDVQEALGSISGDVYTSPNGRKFRGGSTGAVAAAILDLQPQMAHLKEVLGHSPRVMGKKGENAGLAEWSVDAVMKGVESVTGRKVDIGVINYGGIRIDMPEGDVLYDDIVSMFPFRNYLTYIALKGSDVRAILEYMAQTHVQALGGVKMVVNGHKLESAEIGGQPLDDRKTYGMGTVDFLLDGGDGLYLAKNAKELIISKTLVNEWMIPYVRSLTAAGKDIEHVGGHETWLTIKGREEVK